MTKNLLQLEAENIFQNDYDIDEYEIRSTFNNKNQNILKTGDSILDELIYQYNDFSHINLNFQPVDDVKVNTIGELNIKLSKEMRKDRDKLSRTISYQRTDQKDLSPNAKSQLNLFTLSELESSCSYNLNISPGKTQTKEDLNEQLKLFKTIKATDETSKLPPKSIEQKILLLKIPNSTDFYVLPVKLGKNTKTTDNK